jgi:hypothetical protein
VIQRELYKIQQIKLFSLRPDGMYTHETFANENLKHREKIVRALDDFFKAMEAVVQA